MHLTKEDADLYYKLTWSWQFYVNKKTNEFPDVATLDDYCELSADDKIIIRDLCYDAPELFEEYLQLNPDNFNAEELAIMSQWKNPIQGEFQIERYLKNHAIFIAEDEKVYAVLGLYEGFDELIHKSYLPLLGRTSLLPFKGKIVYDGLMQSYSIHFGAGIKRRLKDIYMRAKQNGRIIDTLEATSKKTKKEIPFKSYQKEMDALKKISKTLRGGANQPPLNSPTFSLLKAAIELSEKSLKQQIDYQEIYKAIRKLDRARNKLVKTLDFMD